MTFEISVNRALWVHHKTFASAHAVHAPLSLKGDFRYVLITVFARRQSTIFRNRKAWNILTVDCAVGDPLDEHQQDHVEEEEQEEDDLRQECGVHVHLLLEVSGN